MFIITCHHKGQIHTFKFDDIRLARIQWQYLAKHGVTPSTPFPTYA
jgi:hypothetical protein